MTTTTNHTSLRVIQIKPRGMQFSPCFSTQIMNKEQQIVPIVTSPTVYDHYDQLYQLMRSSDHTPNNAIFPVF